MVSLFELCSFLPYACVASHSVQRFELSAPADHIARAISAADLSGSGALDVLLATDVGLFWLENLGDNRFSEHRAISVENTKASCAVDYDLDGRLDVVALFEDPGVPSPGMLAQRVGFFRNSGPQDSPSFLLSSTVLLDIESADVLVCSDVDSDSDADMLIRSSTTPSSIFYHESSGSVPASLSQVELTSTHRSSVLLSGDVDNGGMQEVITTRQRSPTSFDFIAISDAFAFFPREQTLFSNIAVPQPSSIVLAQVGDLNGDSRLDIVWCSGKTLAWLEQTQPLMFTMHGFLELSSDCIELQAADFDNDGDVDILTLLHTAPSSQIDVYENLGGGDFAPAGRVVADGGSDVLETFYVAEIFDGHRDILAGGGADTQSVLYSFGAFEIH